MNCSCSRHVPIKSVIFHGKYVCPCGQVTRPRLSRMILVAAFIIIGWTTDRIAILFHFGKVAEFMIGLAGTVGIALLFNTIGVLFFMPGQKER